jgi:putative oxidoreductase|tara:strand:+ start:131 stop:556 length:426 start_codon:yes stop_codon:yes gene_type:complete
MTDDKMVPYATLILRITLGVMFIAHGLLKVFVFTPAGTVGFFQSVGLPGFFAYLTIFAELAGGAALILGIYTRLVSLVLIPILIGAIIYVHADAGWLFSNKGGGWEFPAFWAVVLVVQALLGNGPYALKTPALFGGKPAAS